MEFVLKVILSNLINLLLLLSLLSPDDGYAVEATATRTDSIRKTNVSAKTTAVSATTLAPATDNGTTHPNPQLVVHSFEEFRSHFNKTYLRPHEEIRHRRAFADNLKFIKRHNAEFVSGNRTFQIAPNPLADLTNKQYLKRHVRLTNSVRSTVLDQEHEDIVGATLQGMADDDMPDTLDWRTTGFVTPPNNQKSCGSCYAFSVAQSLEGQIFKRIGQIVALSEQQLVDCSAAVGNHGCAGGSLRNTLQYLEQSKGLMREKDYPYVATQQPCAYNPDLSVVNVTSWGILPSKDEVAMQKAVATIGPIPISINASPKTFQLYSNGVYDDPDCTSDKVNHAMLLVGYTDDYWILKNWWGKHWGDNGYMHIKRNKNMCGLANYVAYASV